MVGTLEEQTDSQLLKWFAGLQDEAAFAALVRRHGPMVLAVCRRVLRDAHAADDAFQATFLVLVRKARVITRPELLGNWLYGVAYRVAIKARVNAARRKEYESRAPAMALGDPMSELTKRELRSMVDAELSHLPEKYRMPLVAFGGSVVNRRVPPAALLSLPRRKGKVQGAKPPQTPPPAIMALSRL